MSTDLVSWLRSQLDADEEIARAATAGPWRTSPVDPCGQSSVYSGDTPVTMSYDEPPCFESDAVFIAANDPSRALRTVAAHRAILSLHAPIEYAPGLVDCAKCDAGDPHPCRTLRALASIYEDRPGFDPSWRAD